MSGMEPFLIAAGSAAAAKGTGMAMDAVFGNDVQNSNMMPTVQQGPQASPAMGILQSMQQQMQQEEMLRQQALIQLLTSITVPMRQPHVEIEPLEVLPGYRKDL